jgi:hypothetical protein
MGTKSRESIYGASVRAAAEQAAEARKTADRLACEAWNKRMLGFQGPAQPSPALGDALNAGYLYLEVKCLGCSTHQTVPLNIVRRPKATPIHELERYMRCKDCSTVQAEPSDRTAGDEDFRQRSGVSSLAVSPRSPSRKRANRGRPCVIRIASIRLPQRYGLKLSSRQSCELLGRVDSPEWICSHFF